MTIFKVGFIHGGEDYGKVYCPVDKDDNAIVSCKGLQPSKGYTTTVTKNARLGDMVHCIGGEMLLSQKAWNVLSSLTVQEGTLPLAIELKDQKGKLVGEYVQLLFPKMVDILDHEKTEFKMGRVSPVPIGVKTPVVEPSLIPAADLFRADFLRFVCTERTKERVESARLENFEFTAL